MSIDNLKKEAKDRLWLSMREMQKERGVKVYYKLSGTTHTEKYSYFVRGAVIPSYINKETLIKFEPMTREARRAYLKGLDNI